MNSSVESSKVLTTERLISAPVEDVFAAFERPELLAAWWGPEGFTNTFQHFEFRPGGKWVFTMHNPNGISYHNESHFQVIEPNRKIVIEHDVPPWFLLTITLTPQQNQTLLHWRQEFENAHTLEKIRDVCEPGNEQNLDRLQALLAWEPH